MNYTQNNKIMQVKETTLVVGVDVGSENNYARCFDFRGLEYSKKAFKFGNDSFGYNSFEAWILEHKTRAEKVDVIVGMEPTGHYWFNLGEYLKENEINIVLVNPHHVKKSKELDDNLQSKNDLKDPKIIAGLVKDGRYQIPYIPEGVFAELRTLSNLRFDISKDLIRLSNKIQRWISIYFPEYKNLYSRFDAKSSLILLKEAALPEDIISLGADKINQLWREVKIRRVGKKKAESILYAAKNSVGIKKGLRSARIEIKLLIKDYESKKELEEEIMEQIETLMKEIPNVDKLLEIKGVGVKTVAGFFAEVGDIRRFSSPKQIQKYAGFAIVSDESGKRKGNSRISRRGRKRLRYVLFEVALSLSGKNSEFKEIHKYYTTRGVNPLSKMQSLIAIACKAIRIFYSLLKTGSSYNSEKLITDIKRPVLVKEAA